MREAGSGAVVAPSDANHLSEHELAGFLDDDLAPEERQRVIAHLDQCPRCRRELVDMQQVVDAYAPAREPAATPRREPSGKRWPVVAGIGGLAAAAVVVAMLAGRPGTSEEPLQPRVRGANIPAVGESRQRIAVVAPPESATVSARSVAFSWRPTGADVYRFTLLSESGEPIWTHETPDTTLRLPVSVAPARETAYFWRVDAIADGIAATSGIRVVRMTR